MQQLLIATGNRGRLAEIQSLFDGSNVQLVIPEMLGISLKVEESGSTYEENAALKATAFARLSGMVTLADDSGLEVDVLGGQPGIRSARFSPVPGATDADRRAYLLSMLDRLPQPWTAHFHCTVAIALPDRRVFYAQGNCPGEIIRTERGHNGFGYDPIFLLPTVGLTMAELSMDEKNHLSHRARAIKASLPLVKAILGN